MIDGKQRHARLFRLLLAVIVIAAIPCITCWAQEVGSIDLTRTLPPTEHPQPAAQNGEAQHFRSENVTYECDPSKGSIGKLQITLVWLDKSDYEVGNDPTFEVRIQNTGETSVQIPFSPQRPDLQPVDAGQKLSYSELNLVLWVAGKRWSANTGGMVTLYGAEGRPSTMRTLHPGEWVQVIGKGHLTLPTSFPPPPTDAVSAVNVKVSLYRAETLLSASAAATVETGICVNQTQGPSVAIKLTEPK